MKIRVTEITKGMYPTRNLTVGKEYWIIDSVKSSSGEIVKIIDDKGHIVNLFKAFVEEESLESSYELPQEKSYISINMVKDLLQNTTITFSMDYLTESSLTYRLGTDHAEYAFNNINDTIESIESIEALKFLSANEEG